MRVAIAQGDTLHLLARLTKADGGNVVAADVASINLTIINTATGDTVSTSALSVGSTITNSLAINDRWREDDIGYNFATAIAGSTLTAAGNYRATVTLTQADGGSTSLAWAVQVA